MTGPAQPAMMKTINICLADNESGGGMAGIRRAAAPRSLIKKTLLTSKSLKLAAWVSLFPSHKHTYTHMGQRNTQSNALDRNKRNLVKCPKRKV